MLFDVTVHGYTNFARFALSLAQRKISRDPLAGPVDGVNRVFHTNYYPILTSGSMGVYVSGAQVRGTADYDNGEVVLASAPANQPEGSYTYVPYTTRQMMQFLFMGLDMMEEVWTRGWSIQDGSGNAATEDSAAGYIVDTSGSDPACGLTSFSQSRAQIGFYMACCKLAYVQVTLADASVSDFMWRDGARGMMVDKSKRPSNLQLALEAVRKEVESARLRAQEEFYVNGEQWGGAVFNPVSLEYATVDEWQTQAIAQNNWAFQGYSIPIRPLVYP